MINVLLFLNLAFANGNFETCDSDYSLEHNEEDEYGYLPWSEFEDEYPTCEAIVVADTSETIDNVKDNKNVLSDEVDGLNAVEERSGESILKDEIVPAQQPSNASSTSH